MATRGELDHRNLSATKKSPYRLRMPSLPNQFLGSCIADLTEGSVDRGGQDPMVAKLVLHQLALLGLVQWSSLMDWCEGTSLLQW